MTELPLELKQLVFQTAGDLGLGPSDKIKLETALTKAFTLGMKHADKIVQDEHDRNRRDDKGS